MGRFYRVPFKTLLGVQIKQATVMVIKVIPAYLVGIGLIANNYCFFPQMMHYRKGSTQICPVTLSPASGLLEEVKPSSQSHHQLLNIAELPGTVGSYQ